MPKIGKKVKENQRQGKEKKEENVFAEYWILVHLEPSTRLLHNKILTDLTIHIPAEKSIA